MNARAYDTGALLMLNAERMVPDDRAIDDDSRKPADSCNIANAGTMKLFIDENILYWSVLNRFEPETDFPMQERELPSTQMT